MQIRSEIYAKSECSDDDKTYIVDDKTYQQIRKLVRPNIQQLSAELFSKLKRNYEYNRENIIEGDMIYVYCPPANGDWVIDIWTTIIEFCVKYQNIIYPTYYKDLQKPGYIALKVH